MIIQDEKGQPTASLWIKNARLGFPHLIAPQSVNNGPPKYGCVFILRPEAPEWAEMNEIIGRIAQEKWTSQAQIVLNLVSSDKRLRCFGAGHEKISAQTGEVFEGFDDGGVYISASSDKKPKLYGQNAVELPPTANANEMFVGGNFASGIISFWCQNNEHGRAIRGQLDGVQFISEGEHFGSTGPDAGAIFTAVAGAPAAPVAAPGVPAAAPTGPHDFAGAPTLIQPAVVVPRAVPAAPLAAPVKVIDFL